MSTIITDFEMGWRWKWPPISAELLSVMPPPLQRYASTSDEALHNYPATHFGRNPPHSPIQSLHWKRGGLEPVPNPRGSKIPHCRKLRLIRPVAQTCRKRCQLNRSMQHHL